MLRALTEWLGRSRALRDERKIDSQDNYAAQKFVDERIQAGKWALESEDREAALRHWQEARGRYPDLAAESLAGLRLLIGLKRLDDAEELMREGCGRQPRNPFFVQGLAIVAGWRGDHEGSARHYATLRKKFPRVLEGYTDGTIPLIKLGRLDEADQILGRIADNKGTVSLAIDHARLAMTRKDWPVALRRWTKIWVEHSHEAAALGMAQCYKETGRFDEAEQILMDALKCPRTIALRYRAEMALIAERREAWDETARRWDFVRMLAPSTLDAYCHGAFALGQCGREAEAESLLHEATQRFPSEPQPWIDYARIAEDSGKPDEAEVRWEQVRTRFPDQANQRRTKP